MIKQSVTTIMVLTSANLGTEHKLREYGFKLEVREEKVAGELIKEYSWV